MATSIVLKSAEQQRLSKLKNEDNGEDLISKLPDAMLHYILSFLPTKEIIQTSILCKRWQNLWTSISNIYLEDSVDRTKSDYPKRSASFLNFVERILLVHDDSDIERLCLSFKMPVNPSCVNSWISIALKHNIKKLSVSLPLGQSYILPRRLFTCESLTVLRLQMICNLNPSLIHWPKLKSLHLSRVTFFNESSTQQLFSSFPLLQNLVLIDCGWQNIKHISISIPNLSCLIFQQYLDIIPTEDLLDCKIEVHAANLVYLGCISNLYVNLLISARSLSNASVDLYNYGGAEKEVGGRSISMLSGIQSVRSLIISDETLECLSGAENFSDDVPVFQNLIYLKVACEMSRRTIEILLYLMEKSPNLQILDIAEGIIQDIEFIEDDWNFEVMPSCLKSHLKVISINAIYGQEPPILLLKYLLKHSTVLKRVMVHCPDSVSDSMGKREELKNQLLILPRSSENCVIEVLDSTL
ncbi:F-box/LRR-repeat protein [Abeliophyllum distichum]|uniref:F-box/LRR-repeat protein n=1 Tax=Abeliophyllum distichum TaxID=126358 RepID=A0ABD1QJQ5_9LAMI